MTGCSFNVFVIFTICLTFIFHQCHGFEVIQQPFQTINPDGSVSISCEHTTNASSIEDVRLNSIPLGDKSKRSMLCQKGMKDCKNIVMHSENPKKWQFILLNVGSEAMDVQYECEFTLTINDLDYTNRGTPTKLQPGYQVTEKRCINPAPDLHLNQLSWILIGLLAVIFLYGFAITCLYITLRVQLCSISHPGLQNNNNNKDMDNGTYVEMRKAPLMTNKGFDIYSG